MKKLMSAVLIWFATLATPAAAADFDWTVAFNAKYKLAADQFFDQMAVRFAISNDGISAVFEASKDYSDAFIIFRLAEISKKPVASVLDVYQSQKGRGWGVMAKRLGIKPGSAEFKALKAGHDLGKTKAKTTGSVSVTVNINGAIGGNTKKGK